MKPSRCLLLLVALSGLALADSRPGYGVKLEVVAAPEVNSGSALSALALLSGILVVIRSRGKRSSS